MTFDPHAGRHRMPVVFGPSAGPRQGPDGRSFDMSRAPRTSAAVSFLTERARLEALLPPDCELDGAPIVTVEHTMLRELEWLAGRGYNLLGVRFPVRYRGQEETARGPFLSVLWENRPEPIITGREELGYAKLYCELPEPRVLRGSHCYAASWDGHEFLHMEIGGLEDAQPPAAPATDGVLHYRYLPAISGAAPSVSEMVISPSGGSPMRHRSFRRGTGRLTFVRSTWEQLPTMYHIVNALADLPVLEMTGAWMAETVGAKDLSDQRVLR